VARAVGGTGPVHARTQTAAEGQHLRLVQSMQDCLIFLQPCSLRNLADVLERCAGRDHEVLWNAGIQICWNFHGHVSNCTGWPLLTQLRKMLKPTNSTGRANKDCRPVETQANRSYSSPGCDGKHAQHASGRVLANVSCHSHQWTHLIWFSGLSSTVCCGSVSAVPRPYLARGGIHAFGIFDERASPS
jgi:hypothetical protein